LIERKLLYVKIISSFTAVQQHLYLFFIKVFLGNFTMENFTFISRQKSGIKMLQSLFNWKSGFEESTSNKQTNFFCKSISLVNLLVRKKCVFCCDLFHLSQTIDVSQQITFFTRILLKKMILILIRKVRNYSNKLWITLINLEV